MMVNMKDYKVQDFRKEMWNGLKQYYVDYLYCGGCDPAYSLLSFIAEKEKFSLSQRYWISMLYGCTYCDATAYYIMKKLPDFEETTTKEVEKFWLENKPNLLFVSDKAKVKNFNAFTKIFDSYKKIVKDNQVETFKPFIEDGSTPQERYKKVYELGNKIYYFGRFTLFNYLETLNEITPLNVVPDTINLKEAESCKNGLCYAASVPNQITLHHKPSKEPTDYEYLNKKLKLLKKELQEENPEIEVTYYNIETALCGYKKLFWNTRYLGYYIDRHCEGIKWMEDHNEDFDFSLFWEFRKKYLHPLFNIEKTGDYKIREDRLKLVTEHGTLYKPDEEPPLFTSENLIPHLRRKQTKDRDPWTMI